MRKRKLDRILNHGEGFGLALPFGDNLRKSGNGRRITALALWLASPDFQRR